MTTKPETVADVLAEMKKEAARETLGRERDEGYNDACSHWANRIESALAADAEPVLGWANPRDVEKVRRPRSRRDGSALAVFIHGEQSEDYSIPIFTHAQPAAKVEAPGLVLQLLAAGGFVDPAKVEQAREIIAGCAPPSASVADGCRPLEEWHEDIGPVVWWSQDSESDYDAWRGEPAWIGTPLDDDWPGYHTHFTPHPDFPRTVSSKEASA